MEKNKNKTVVYLISSNSMNLYKIGVSKDVNIRIKQLQTGCPYELLVESIFESDFPYKVESVLHRRFATKKIDENSDVLKGEWFQLETQEVLGFQDICKKIENTFLLLKKSKNPFFM